MRNGHSTFRDDWLHLKVSLVYRRIYTPRKLPTISRAGNDFSIPCSGQFEVAAFGTGRVPTIPLIGLTDRE